VGISSDSGPTSWWVLEMKPGSTQVVEPVANCRSQSNQSAMPTPVRALTGKIAAAGLTSRTRATYESTSASKYGTKSILLSKTTSTDRNITGYFSGLSSPSVTEDNIAFACSPTSNSAGQTRLPTFSMITRSNPGRSRPGSARLTMGASRWHSPPNPLLVLSSDTWAPRPLSFAASRSVAMSPSTTPIENSPASSSSVACNTVVLPDPGELIRLTARIPLLSNAARLASAR